MDAFISLAVHRRWLTVLVSALACFAIASGVVRLVEVDVDFRNHFSKDDPRLVALEQLEETYALSDSLLVVMAPQSGAIFTREALTAVEEMTEQLWQTPFVTRVDSITNYSHSWADGDELFVEVLIDEAAALSQDDLERIKEIALGTEEIAGRFVSRDGRIAGLVVNLVLPDVNRQQAKVDVVDFLHAAVAEASSSHADIEYHVTGELLLNRAIRDALNEDTAKLGLVAFVTMLVVAFALLHSVSAVGAIIVMMVAVVISGLGFAGWTGMKLYGESGAALFVLMAVAVAHSMHVIEGMLAQMRQGMDRRKAAIHSVQSNAWPVFLTSATTAIGFLSLNFSEMPPFRVMGNIVAFGAMCAFVLAVTLLPALLSLLPVSARPLRAGKRAFFDLFGRFVVTHHIALLVSCGAVIIALIAGITRIELNENPLELLDRSYEYRRSTDFVSENFSGLEPFEYSLSAGREAGITDVEYLRDVDAFAAWYRAQPEVAHVFALTDILKRLNQSLNGDDPESYVVPEESALAAQYLLLYEFSLPMGLDLNNLIDVERSASRMTVVLKNLSAKEKIDLDSRAQAWLRLNAPSLETGATGATLIGAYSIKRNIEKMLIGTFVAMSVVSLLLVFIFRSLRFGLISLIPNFVPAAMAMGAWGYAVGEIGVAASVVTALAFGIIVDDTIHFLTKYLRSRKQGLLPSESVQSALSTVGKALFATTVVFALGFLVFGASGMASNQTLGLLLGTTVIIALLADFLFLPPLLIALDGAKESTRQIRERLKQESD
ncbi:MAG: MMPL family transporter [Boseongicola sp. SB0676_bin_33]|nr:MMPL family transporter [Boseongicola sp. SB0676_bin_33]